MKLLNKILVLVATVALVIGSYENDEEREKAIKKMPLPKMDIPYKRYLKEVLLVLEKDPGFTEKIMSQTRDELREGKVFKEMHLLSYKVRTKLDEAKRREIERLRQLANEQFELDNAIQRDHPHTQHLDHKNEHFTSDDFLRLMVKTTMVLDEADRIRREKFKKYEMEKEFEKQAKLKEMDEEHKKKYKEELKELKEKHSKHPKVHHPGNEAQLEEVWEEQDHMDKEDFNPKKFFMLHDLDGNLYWDAIEVKALFIKELNKAYGEPEDDIVERAEEMERMREHVFKEIDLNRDGLISMKEFIDQTKRKIFKSDPEWKTIDSEQEFTQEEYLEFERQRQKELESNAAKQSPKPQPNML